MLALAVRLGTVREVAGRTLRSLSSDGNIEFDRHRIVILDLQHPTEEAEAQLCIAFVSKNDCF